MRSVAALPVAPSCYTTVIKMWKVAHPALTDDKKSARHLQPGEGSGDLRASFLSLHNPNIGKRQQQPSTPAGNVVLHSSIAEHGPGLGSALAVETFQVQCFKR